MREVDKQNLFIAPGGHVGQSLHEALDQYEAEIKQWRSEGYQTTLRDVPKGTLLLNGLFERLAPHYHLLENSEELAACPFIAVDAPWHYYSLVSKFFAARLKAQGNLNEEALVAIDSITNEQQKWLGDVPLAHLVNLLSNCENERFRIRLNELVIQLRNARVSDLNKIVPEVCAGMTVLLKGHNTEIKAIQKKYRRRYDHHDVAAYVTKGAAYMPSLGPTIRLLNQADIDQSQGGKDSEPMADESKPANSLLGVLAVAGRN